jgi:RimJ/RimL family protein N-acetyltransferase
VRRNHLNQPIGEPVEWTPPPAPPREPFEGRYCRVEPLEPERHARGLWDANARDVQGRNWTYLSYGPFERFEAYEDWVCRVSEATDPLFFCIVTEDGPAGVAAYLRVAPEAGSIEVGHINFSPLLQRTRAATEAMYLMMRRAFELGYRRYEWKCDALNAPSRAAAQRLGLSFEGVFRQALVTKGRNRDTAWYAAIDQEWPALRAAFEQWLDSANFDAKGQQRQALSVLTKTVLVRRG